MKPPTDPGTLLTRKEMRQVIPLSRQRIFQITATDDFPAPVDVLDDGRMPVWNRGEVVEFWRQRQAPDGE
jgi:predicted DNA-binding transcriptional regulator AlpA